MDIRTTDLNDPDTPDAIPTVLRNAAQKMYEQASELESAWQDKAGTNPWNMVARELERAAERIISKL